jgi:peptidoglycan hydrolase-like protein with peptidoglycan-binding domain
MAESSSSKSTQKRTAAKKAADQKSEVVLADLCKGTADSESVRLLQKKLQVKVTGTYDSSTQAAVRTWQNENGFLGGRGRRLDEQQASKLFGDDTTFTDSAN